MGKESTYCRSMERGKQMFSPSRAKMDRDVTDAQDRGSGTDDKHPVDGVPFFYFPLRDGGFGMTRLVR